MLTCKIHSAQMEASKFATPSLRFSKLNRSNIDIIYDAKISPGTTLRLQAVEGIPAAPFRIFNASNLKSLVLRSDQGTPASLINTVRFGVKLTSDDVRANASFHDVSHKQSFCLDGELVFEKGTEVAVSDKLDSAGMSVACPHLDPKALHRSSPFNLLPTRLSKITRTACRCSPPQGSPKQLQQGLIWQALCC